MEILLEAKNIAHHFDYELFTSIDLSLHAGQSIAIIGKSGSGKSTLLNIMATLLRPDKGEVFLFGKSVATLKQKELIAVKRKKLGIIFQSHYLFKGFSAYENLEVASLLANEPVDTALLEALEIEGCMEQKVTELSGGQQQRVSIARVLTKKPRIIFADEPTGNLDKETAKNVMDLLFAYVKANDAALLLVTHDRELAYRCGSVFELKDKRLTKVSDA